MDQEHQCQAWVEHAAEAEAVQWRGRRELMKVFRTWEGTWQRVDSGEGMVSDMGA